MRGSPVTGLTALAVVGTALIASPAQAADPTVLYVDRASSSCSDTGSGSQTQPFCTIGAAAKATTAGTVVKIASGTYPEQVTVTQSGTKDSPITFEGIGATAPDLPDLGGPTAGFVVDGQHDVVIRKVGVEETAAGAAFDIRNSSAVLLDSVSVYKSTGVGIRFSGATDAKVTGSTLSTIGPAVTADAATTGLTVTSSRFSGWETTSIPGIKIAGSGTKVVDNDISQYNGAAVEIGPGAVGTTVVNNEIETSQGRGVVNRSATGTAITNNDVKTWCGDGIRVEGASSDVSVQNNVVNKSYDPDALDCDEPAGVAIGIYGDARQDTIVDYNNTYAYASAYSWDGARMDLAAFRTASGQAAHDRNTWDDLDRQDSANSAAPGYPSTDRSGTARADNPNVADAGAGPVTYADRGNWEIIGYPVAELDASLDLGAGVVTADASGSKPGWYPLTSYRFDFGDGTVVTQSTPVATHSYGNPGTYQVTVRVSGADDRAREIGLRVTVLRRISTVGLLARSNLKYVAPVLDQTLGLRADHYGVDSVDKFDVADAGGGKIALYSRSAQGYVNVQKSGDVYAGDPSLSAESQLTSIRNGDGSISLRAGTDTYLSTSGYGGILQAKGTTISRFEQFHLVNVTDSNRTLKARANARYVTASNTAASPLIANATGIGVAQKYDLVDLGNSQWAIFARANNRFVTATNAGTLPLINTNVVPGTWEKFTRITNSDGSLSLRSVGNSRYVTADNAGASPLITKHTAITSWDQYTLG